MDRLANSTTVRVLSTNPTEDVEQVFDIGKGIDQLVDDFGKRVL
jgi:hypothetical protein